MHRFQSLAAKLGMIGGSLLLVALASISFTLWASWQLEGGAAAVNEAGRMRMQTWRLAQTLSRGDLADLKKQIAQFDQSIALLRSGDPSRPLFMPRDLRSSAEFTRVSQTWLTVRAAWLSRPAPDAASAAAQADAFVTRVDALVTAIEQRLATLTATLNVIQIGMMGLILASAVMLLYCAYLFIFNPLERLKSGLARVRSGDLSARIKVASRDEFGALAEGFNRMAETLQGLYQDLEVKVAEKTHTLSAQHARLLALYEASAFAAQATTLYELAAGFAKQLKPVAHADAIAIRWCDEDNRRYLLLAAEGLAPEVSERENCIHTGNCACGQPSSTATTRVITIGHSAGPDLAGHCERAGYRVIISVPVRLQERIVGEIDLFYVTDSALPGEDRILLDAMADHLATAIEGLRASALAREAAVARERGLIASELHDSIAQSLAFMKIQIALLRNALSQHDDGKISRAIGELEAGIQESLSDVRELLMHFRTRTNIEDILPALQTTLQKFEHQTGVATHLAVSGNGIALPADVQIQVLHIVQEALSNIRKHARARAVWVSVRQTSPWRVEVRDDGRGFSTDAVSRHDGTQVGLRIMRERAEHIGANLEIQSTVGTGTRVALTLPDNKRLAI